VLAGRIVPAIFLLAHRLDDGMRCSPQGHRKPALNEVWSQPEHLAAFVCSQVDTGILPASQRRGSMDQQRGHAAATDRAAEAGEKITDLAAQTRTMVQDKMDHARPALQDLQASAGEAMKKTTELARTASDIGLQAAKQGSDAIQGAAREVANQAYQQGSRAGESLSQYVAEQPLTALLVAGAIGYGLAYLVHRH
jgi:ElaB/YqjD/DUF883 family membrane-anchored ribosome-binding protein